jgi:hypothetical protein
LDSALGSSDLPQFRVRLRGVCHDSITSSNGLHFSRTGIPRSIRMLSTSASFVRTK